MTALSTRSRLVVAAAAVSRAASGGVLATALAVYVGRQGDVFAVGLLSTAFWLGTMVFGPVWGAIGDATGRRRELLVVVSLATTATGGAFLVVDSVSSLVGLRGIYAACAVGFSPLLLSVVADLTGRDRRGQAAGFVSSALAAGDVLAQFSVGILLGLLAPSGIYLVVAGLGLLATVVVGFVPDGNGPEVDGGADAARDADIELSLRTVLSRVRSRLFPSRAERAALAESGLGALFAGLALRHVAVRGVGSLVPVFLLVRLGLGEVTMGLLLTVAPLLQVGLMTGIGNRTDTTPRRLLVLTGMACSTGYVLLLAAAATTSAVEARIALVGLGFTAIAAGFSALDLGAIAFVGDVVPPDRESAFVGLRSTVGGLGGVVGPTLVGGLAALTSFETAFAASSLLVVAGGLLVYRKMPEPPRQTSPATNYRTVETAVGIVRPVAPRNGPPGADDD